MFERIELEEQIENLMASTDLLTRGKLDAMYRDSAQRTAEITAGDESDLERGMCWTDRKYMAERVADYWMQWPEPRGERAVVIRRRISKRRVRLSNIISE